MSMAKPEVNQYYVTNHTDADVVVGDKVIKPNNTEPVHLTREDARVIKTNGWNIRRRLIDKENGLIEGGSSNALSITDIDEDGTLHLNLEHAGQVFFFENGVDVVVPHPDDVDFPVGTVITLITDGSSVAVYPGDGEGIEVIGIGPDFGYSGNWVIRERSISTLVHVKYGQWYLSGPCVEED